jgi:hypothetical protein
MRSFFIHSLALCVYVCNEQIRNYLWYGFVATLLESIPIAGPTIFNLSNACGAALWACHMEAETGGPPSLLESAQQQVTVVPHHKT